MSETETQSTPRLARHLNVVTGMGLPPWSVGPKSGSEADILIAAKQSGYEGVQTSTPGAARDVGLVSTGMARIVRPEEAAHVAARHKSAGCVATTLHVGTGLEDDRDMDVLVRAILQACEQHDYPLYIETHRATITQDMRRTVDLVKRFKDVRFNADLSHYYAGQEMPYGDIEAKFDFLEPVFSRVRFIHGRIADSACLQASIEPDDPRPFVVHHAQMWQRCARGFKETAPSDGVMICAIELLPYAFDLPTGRLLIHYAIQRPNTLGEYEDEADRWQQAELVWQVAQKAFAAA